MSPVHDIDEVKAQAALDPNRVTPDQIKNHPEVRALIALADRYLDTVGYTDHGIAHVTRVAYRAHNIVRDLRLPLREAELAMIAGYLHDIGNVVHRVSHAQSGALLAIPLLSKLGMPINEVAMVAGAIANHDDSVGDPVSSVSAALILADKSDVLRTRVRNPKMISFDIHDRVNYAAIKSEMGTDLENRVITLKLKIDTSISQVIEYFEIFMSRMAMSRRGANFLKCDFRLIINDVQLM